MPTLGPLELAVKELRGAISARKHGRHRTYDRKLKLAAAVIAKSLEIPEVQPKAYWQCNGCNRADRLTNNTCPNCGRTKEESDAIR